MSRVGRAVDTVRLICLFMVCAGLFLLVLPATAFAGSAIHGEVYDWATFDTMNNAVVEVYSMPENTFIERAVVKNGSYSFDLPAGAYLIYAKAGTPGTLSELLVTENITVIDNGDYTIDLILFPPTGLEYLEALNESELNSTVPEQVVQPSATPQPPSPGDLPFIGIGLAILAAVILAGGAYLFWSRARKKSTPGVVSQVTEKPAEEKTFPQQAGEETDAGDQQIETFGPQVQPPQMKAILDPTLPPDCRDVLTIMEKNGGRITQLELRKLLPYSEAKVSLIVSDLENRGIVKKIKKGRGNILILNRPGEQLPEK